MRASKMSDVENLKYGCVNELVQAARINFTGKEPHNVYSRLPAMRKKFEAARNQGDDETAYIFLRRWLNSVEWIKKSREYKAGKSIYSTNMTVDQVGSRVQYVCMCMCVARAVYHVCHIGSKKIYECLYSR